MSSLGIQSKFPCARGFNGKTLVISLLLLSYGPGAIIWYLSPCKQSICLRGFDGRGHFYTKEITSKDLKKNLLTTQPPLILVFTPSQLINLKCSLWHLNTSSLSKGFRSTPASEDVIKWHDMSRNYKVLFFHFSYYLYFIPWLQLVTGGKG